MKSIIKFFSDIRFILVLWLAIAGQAAFREFNRPDEPLLWARVLGACTPATLLLGIAYFVARAFRKKDETHK